MLEGLKRLFSGGLTAQRGWQGLAPWAASKQYAYREVGSNEGFIVEGRLGALPWRLEWGPSQRNYIQGQELRLRAELGLPSDLQVVLMNRQLQEKMEREVFEQYVEGVQTRIDSETPPEMRWLVMFPKLEPAETGRLRDRYVVLGSIKPWLVAWIDGALAATLTALALPADQPFVLMVSRGRMTMRTPLAEPEARDLEPWIRLFETAMREARRVAGQAIEAGPPSTHPSLWSSTSGLPPDDTPR